MDKDEQAKLEGAKRDIEKYLSHPFTKRIFDDSVKEQEALVRVICNNDIIDLATFFAHFAAVGHLRGLRRAQSLFQDDLEDIETELKEAKE